MSRRSIWTAIVLAQCGSSDVRGSVPHVSRGLALGARRSLARVATRGGRSACVRALAAAGAATPPSAAPPASASSLNSYLMLEGPPSFFEPPRVSPISAAEGGEGLPAKAMLLYVPGIELSGYTISKQLSRLEPTYDVRVLRVAPDDRTRLPELVLIVMDEVRAWRSRGRKVVLMGESFGGVVALDAALTLGEAGKESGLACLVLINPATVIGRTPWPALAAFLESIPDGVYDALPSLLAPILANPLRMLDFRPEEAAPHQTESQSVSPVTAAAPAAGDDGVAGGGGGSAADSESKPEEPTTLAGAWASPAVVVRRLQEMIPSLEQLPRALPQSTLAFRLRQLDAHAALLEARDWSAVRVPALVLASTNDNVLPAQQAARALASRLLGARVRTLQGAGHAPLIETEVDLSRIFEQEDVLRMPTPRPRDYVTQFSRPTAAQIEAASATLRPLRRLVSPRFFSTLPTGTRLPGLAALPRPRADGQLERPVLFVGNHQLLGMTDLPLLIEELLVQRNLLARGLAHPLAFNGGVGPGKRALANVAAAAGAPSGAGAGRTGAGAGADRHREGETLSGAQAERTPSGAGRAEAEAAAAAEGSDPKEGPLDFATFGAVPVSARNLLRVLRRNEAALLYPGGIREAFKRKGERYTLFWPAGEGEADFVTIAARCSALVIPVAAVGAEDGFSLVYDSSEMLGLPGPLGEAVRRASDAVPHGRAGEDFVTPLALPQLPPPRYYFCFGRPFDTAELDQSDPTAASALYAAVRAELEGSIQWLLSRRQEDPYSDFAQRLLYEAAADWKRQAPTFRL